MKNNIELKKVNIPKKGNPHFGYQNNKEKISVQGNHNDIRIQEGDNNHDKIFVVLEHNEKENNPILIQQK